MSSASGSILSLVLLGEGGGGDVTWVEGVDRVKGGGRAPPLPHQAGPKTLSRLYVHKKVAIASLSTLSSVVTD
jgi:hypothetical protein